MKQEDKKLLDSANNLYDIGMIIFYIAAAFTFGLAGMLAGNATYTGEITIYAYIAYLSMFISLISGLFLGISYFKYKKYVKKMNIKA